MGSVKIKGNWNQQKSKIKLNFSEHDEENDELFTMEEEILRTHGGKKAQVKKKKKDWN